MRATAFLGAGSALEIGGPSTENLTKAVRNTKQHYPITNNSSVERTFIDDIARELDSYFYPTSCNFEEIFHVIESLFSFITISPNWTASMFKSPLRPFLRHADSKWFNQWGLISAQNDLRLVIAERIVNYMKRFEPNGCHSWFSNFWQRATARCSWDFATLNYDDCLERSIAGAYEDGFERLNNDMFRFQPAKLIETEQNRVMHLHGSVFYGHDHFRDPKSYVFEDHSEDLYRFDDFEKAKSTWTGRSTYTAQAREKAIIGPIVTGLRKTDKLVCLPYSTYYWMLEEAVRKSPRLLIVGYSFGDFHFNGILERIVRHHGKERRIVIITYFQNPSDWRTDHKQMKWPELKMFRFIQTAFFTLTPFKKNQFVNPLVSKDGCAMLFLTGMKDTFYNYGDAILDFLCS